MGQGRQRATCLIQAEVSGSHRAPSRKHCLTASKSIGIGASPTECAKQGIVEGDAGTEDENNSNNLKPGSSRKGKRGHEFFCSQER